MEIIPIWKDHPITIATSEAYVDYEIQLEDGTTLYTGRAFKLPGADSVQIIPNEVCAPYVAVTMPIPLPGEYSVNDPGSDYMTKTFNLKANGTTQTFTFSANYGYQPDVPNIIANAPITGKIARNQLLMISLYHANSDKHTRIALFYNRIDGGWIDRPFDLALPSGIVMPVDIPLYHNIRVQSGTESLTYDIVDTCARYILYYVNAFGAWDSLIVDGTVKQTDEYTRETFKKSYVTTIDKRQPRGTVDIQNDITRKYSLVTDWLTDEQSARMHHLLGSTNVYLYDMITDEYLPVVLTNSSCEYKTFRNQGARLVNYTIEATAAQNHTRR